VYVSYLSVDPSLAAMDMPLGVQCDGERDFGDTNRYYTVRGPAPAAGRTVRYRIGTCTNPLVADFDDYGIPLGYPRVSTFDADGDGLVDSLDSEPIVCGGDFHGQSDAWVQATFTNAAEILSVGYPQWVDAQVGVGLTNGLYKLTVSLDSAPLEPTLLSVGEYSVVVTNEGDYVFLLEKGLRYSLGFSSVPPGVAYSCDDGTADVGGGGMLRGPIGSPVYTVSIAVSYPDEDPVELVEPTDGEEGHVLYSPWLSIAPPGLLDPTFPVIMTADVFDIPAGVIPSVVWESGGETLSSWEYLTLTGEEDFDNRVIVVTATCRDAVLLGTVTIERHVRASSISLNGGGAIIVEDSYTNAPGEIVSASSTSAAIDLSWALASPGSLRLSTDVSGVLATNSHGTVFNLPRTWRGEADEEGDMRLFIRSPDTSGRAGTVTFKFTPDGGGAILTQTVPLQVVKIRVEAEALWPSNRVRHVFGVNEEFHVISDPGGVVLSTNASEVVGDHNIGILIGGIAATVSITTIAPQSNVNFTWMRTMTGVDWMQKGWQVLCDGDGVPGAGFMASRRLNPSHVSFMNIYVMEGLAPMSDRGGCFENEIDYPPADYAHGTNAGANWPIMVSAIENIIDGEDCAAVQLGVPPDTNGMYSLHIPMYWGLDAGSCTNQFATVHQHVFADTNGLVRVSKEGIFQERNCLDGYLNHN
jgi:hypothetical protein